MAATREANTGEATDAFPAGPALTAADENTGIPAAKLAGNVFLVPAG